MVIICYRKQVFRFGDDGMLTLDEQEKIRFDINDFANCCLGLTTFIDQEQEIDETKLDERCLVRDLLKAGIYNELLIVNHERVIEDDLLQAVNRLMTLPFNEFVQYFVQLLNGQMFRFPHTAFNRFLFIMRENKITTLNLAINSNTRLKEFISSLYQCLHSRLQSLSDRLILTTLSGDVLHV